MGNRSIQFMASGMALAAVVGAGFTLPRIIQESDQAKLRYTEVSVDGAPPIVAVGAAIGALRGLVVDYLWIRLQQMRELGLFYDAQRLADLITKLQPRFGEVWAFHGHNMAYNLSVATSTPEERWRLVNAGIDLIRNKGLRYNPNDLLLNKELAWYFAHKIDGVSDDANIYYKREFAREWHLLLGPPPYDREERAKWMQTIADAPATAEELYARNPDVKQLVDTLTERLKDFDRRNQFKLDKEFLMNLGRWAGVRSSPYAQMLGLEKEFRQRDAVFVAMDQVLADPKNRPALAKLTAFLRKKVLLEDYNMDPAIMARYIRDFGPLDFRHPQAHAFYWARLGSEVGAERYDNQEDIYRIINDDRVAIQAMQALAHTGLMSVDPFSSDNPGRLFDPRWITSIDKYFRELYTKHFKARGSGGDTFVDFHQNFTAQAIRELYHSGDTERAQQLLKGLDDLYGRGGMIPSMRYAMPLEDFVRESTLGEYLAQPDVARTDVYAVLRRGFLEGYLLDNKKVLDESLKYARDLTAIFKGNRYTDFVTKMGDSRMADLLGSLERSVEDVLIGIMRDSSLPLLDRLLLYTKLPEDQKAMVYDSAKDLLAAEFAATPLSKAYTFQAVFPEPPNMDGYRARQAELARQRAEELKARQDQGPARKQ
ncbi:MAG: hypothetical protein U0636_06105 [Phycisphaerales bacterium]